MTRTRTEYADIVKLTCIENNQTLEAEILDYRPAYSLTVSVNRQVKVYLKYNNMSKKYTGNVGRLEFETAGPTETTFKQGR